MKKPRVLIIISIQFTVRILIRTGFINRISKYVKPVIALGWKDSVFEAELKAMGADVHYFSKVILSDYHRHAKNKINYIVIYEYSHGE